MTTPQLTPFAPPRGAAQGPSGGRSSPATAASIALPASAGLKYQLRVADTCLVLAQRLGEWCGHAPVLEEDIALANMALDLIGQTRALLSHAGRELGLDEDQLAFLRDERDYLNLTLCELPRGDFAFTVLRNLMVSAWLLRLWQRLADSTDAEVAAIAGKAVKEARYHRQHAADWLLRLAGGTDESRRRTEAALDELWRYVPEMFADDEVESAAAASGLGVSRAALRDGWLADMHALFAAAGLTPPAESGFRSRASDGVHTEHMGYLLAEMQSLQRKFPGGVW